MTVPKTILLPTDFSGRCDRPRERAIQLAREWGARLVVLHVLPGAASDAEAACEENVAQAEARLRAEVQARDIQTSTRLAFGSVVQEILNAATAVGAGLIVMGVSRHDEIGDFVVGTTVERVVRHGSVPTLVVKMLTGPHYSNLMVGTDFSQCSIVALQAAVDLFPAAKITLLHAYQVRLETLRGRDGPAGDQQAEIAFDLEAFLDKVSLTGDVRDQLEINVDYGDVCSVAADHARTSGTDLTVVGTQGRSGLIGEIVGSTAQALMTRLDCDILLVRQYHRSVKSAGEAFVETDAD